MFTCQRLSRPVTAKLVRRPELFSAISATASIRTVHHGRKKPAPPWLQAVFHDKRTYFQDIDHIEKCFLTGFKQNTSTFHFDFADSPSRQHRKIKTSFLALRECCQCPKCFDPSPQQRVRDVADIDPNEKPSRVSFDRDKQLLHITWASDGHKSVYAGPWLYATFTPHPLFEYPKRQLWKADGYLKTMKKFEYDSVHSNPIQTLEFLDTLAKSGLAIIKNAPIRRGTLDALSKHICSVRRTHYGEYFQVEVMPKSTNVAYSYARLGQHIDLTYFDLIPQVQLLHFIRQSGDGGESTFADGFAVAEWFRQNDKATFDILSSTKIYFYNYFSDASGTFLMQKKPVIILGSDKKQLKRICFGNLAMDSLRHLSADDQAKYLKALACFIDKLESPEYRITIKMNPGEIVAFDNTRVTHGREAFHPNQARLLEGCYYNWDEVFSRMRLIQSQQFRQELARHYNHYSL